jgi:hypothetical protein
MKKKMIVLLAGALLTLGMASYASAALFSEDDLIRVVYNATSGVETATDLGAISTITADANGTVLGGGTGAFTTNGSPASANANAYVAYFTLDTNNGYLWVSGSTTKSLAPKGISSSFSSSASAMDAVLGVYQAANTTNGNNNGTVQSATVVPSGDSYYAALDASGTSKGTLGGVIYANNTHTEASLATLASAAVTQGLYYFNSIGSSNQTGSQILELQTNANGTTTLINPNTPSTPIPPSFFLMGSGLLGMFGLRRKRV